MDAELSVKPRPVDRSTAEVKEVACDQAIFTSVRTRMGEGYRIIASSLGLKAEEKQAITRRSPSHDALCSREPDAEGIGFYALPTGRLCVASSGYAGVEHTGRGGQRVYTLNVVFSPKDFGFFGCNPFAVVRKLRTQGLLTPQLKPCNPLPGIRLSACDGEATTEESSWIAPLDSTTRQYLVHGLLNGGTLILCVAGDFARTAEALLMAVPGRARANVSLSAGVKFSAGRRHRFIVLSDDEGVTRRRIEGQPVVFLDAQARPPCEAPSSDWLRFVNAHLERGALAVLAERTSRPFPDVSPVGRERVAKLYLALDDLPKADEARLLAILEEFAEFKGVGLEADLRAQLLEGAQSAMLACCRVASVDYITRHWVKTVETWRKSQELSALLQPVVERMLGRVAESAPMEAAELALAIAPHVPEAALAAGHGALLDHVLNRFADRCVSLDEEQRPAARALCKRWRDAKPDSPIISRITESLSGRTKP
jgi:hypothetical protein